MECQIAIDIFQCIPFLTCLGCKKQFTGQLPHLTSETHRHFILACWDDSSGRILGSKFSVFLPAVAPGEWPLCSGLPYFNSAAALALWRVFECWFSDEKTFPNLCQLLFHLSRDVCGPEAWDCVLTSWLDQLPKIYSFSVSSWFSCMKKADFYAFGHAEMPILWWLRWWTTWS